MTSRLPFLLTEFGPLLAVALFVFAGLYFRERRVSKERAQKEAANRNEIAFALKMADEPDDAVHGAQFVLDQLMPTPDPTDSGFKFVLKLPDSNVTPADSLRFKRVVTTGAMRGLITARADGYAAHTDLARTLLELRGTKVLSLRSPIPTAQPGSYSLPAHDVPTGKTGATLGRDFVKPFTDPAANGFTGAGALDREMVEHFAREMGQQEGTIEYLIRHAGEIDVQRLWATMDLVLRHDDAGFRRPITQAMKSIERSIDDARGQFPSAHLAAVGAASQLNDFADKLKSMTVVMVMLPGAIYDNTINKLERELEADKGAGKLDAGSVNKHKMIVRHRSELAKAEYSEDHWDAVQQSLLKFHNGLDSLAADRPPTRMM